MRKIFLLMAIAGLMYAVNSCESTAWNELTPDVSTFVQRYFPSADVASFNTLSTGSVVQIRNGATITFNSDNVWTDVNGNGNVLPTMFITDELPEALVDYLEESEAVTKVFRVTRDADICTVELHDTSVEYNYNTDKVTYPSARD